MREGAFLAKFFVYCSNFNTPVCLESDNIQTDLYLKIELVEDEYPEPVHIGHSVVEISNKYCQACSNFSPRKAPSR